MHTLPLPLPALPAAGIPKWPYWYPQGDDGSMVNVSDPYAANWTGFLRPLLDAACEGASLDCELVFFKELTERIPLVQNVRIALWLLFVRQARRSHGAVPGVVSPRRAQPGPTAPRCSMLPPPPLQGEVDFIIDTLSATDERAQQVDFVSPGFFSAGVSLYTTPVSPLPPAITFEPCAGSGPPPSALTCRAAAAALAPNLGGRLQHPCCTQLPVPCALPCWCCHRSRLRCWKRQGAGRGWPTSPSAFQVGGITRRHGQQCTAPAQPCTAASLHTGPWRGGPGTWLPALSSVHSPCACPAAVQRGTMPQRR